MKITEAVANSDQIEKVKAPDLKAFLKDLGVGCTGEKGVLIARLKWYYQGEKCKIDGKNPVLMTNGELKKACARNAVSTIGHRDEQLELLLAKLQASGGGGAANGTPAKADGGSAPTGSSDPVALAMEVIRLDDLADYEGILSLLGEKLTEKSPIVKLRKAYLKMSLHIHPDKLQKKFGDSKKAFQCLVHAFERLTNPDMVEETGKKSKHKALARSNDGCVMTRIKCPRCKELWGAKVEGNPDYCYNFMMTGLRQFHCSTCLLEFGCMGAIHECRDCTMPFEYHPDDYHRKIKCGNGRCNKEFGFWMFPCPESALKAVKADLKQKLEGIRKREAGIRRRAERGNRRGRGDSLTGKEQEKAFLFNLRDECPKCGMELLGKDDDRVAHLMECNDTGKHKAYKAKQAKAAAKAASKAQVQEKQMDVQASATWSALGSTTGTLWMLSDSELKKQLKAAGLSTEGNRQTLLKKLAAYRAKTFAIGDVQDTIPQDLSSMDDSELKDVLICNNVDMKEAGIKSKKAMMKTLDRMKMASALEIEKQNLPILFDVPKRLRLQNSDATPPKKKLKLKN